MDVTIRFASQPEELDQIFRIRHDVFVTESGYMAPHADARIYDRFDAFSTSRHIIATRGGEVIGCTRLTQNSAVGTSADEYFDFIDCIPTNPQLSGAPSMCCVRKAHHGLRVGFYLFCFAWETARRSGWDCIYSVINPEIKETFVRMGFQMLNPVQFNSEKGVNFIPVSVAVSQLAEDYQRVMRSIPESDWFIEIAQPERRH